MVCVCDEDLHLLLESNFRCIKYFISFHNFMTFVFLIVILEMEKYQMYLSVNGIK